VIVDLIMTIILVALSGIFSGLTLGLFSLDPDELLRTIELGGPDAVLAKKIFPVRKDGNLLLCTLLLGNVAVNSYLSIFLGNVTSGLMGGILATSLIVILGEIVPQAAFSRYALQVGAATAWLVKFFMIILFPLCKPIAICLDKALGAELPTIYSKKELQLILKAHQKSKDSDVKSDNATIAIGALTFSEKTVGDVMTPDEKVHGLSEETPITAEQLTSIKNGGNSRLPVWKQGTHDLCGVLHVKSLIGIRGDEGQTVKDLLGESKHFEFTEDLKLDKAMHMYLDKGRDFGVVRDAAGAFAGIITLEDILEEIIQQEIYDDDDFVPSEPAPDPD